MAVSGFTRCRGFGSLVDSDHMYKLCRVDLPFHGIVGGLSASGHHDVNEGHKPLVLMKPAWSRLQPGLAHREGLHEAAEGLLIVVDPPQGLRGGHSSEPTSARFQFPTRGKLAVEASVWNTECNLVKSPNLWKELISVGRPDRPRLSNKSMMASSL